MFALGTRYVPILVPVNTTGTYAREADGMSDRETFVAGRAQAHAQERRHVTAYVCGEGWACAQCDGETYAEHAAMANAVITDGTTLARLETALASMPFAYETADDERTTDGTERDYRVPPTFYADHSARDLPSGAIVKTTKRYVLVSLTDAEFAELLADAEHYAHEGTRTFGADYLGLVRSADATVKALRTQRARHEDGNK